MLSSLSRLAKYVYILGDFNINLFKYNTNNATETFVNYIYYNSYIPLINRPSRVTETTATLIDNIITNCLDGDNCVSGIILAEMSDHFPIFYITCHQMLQHAGSDQLFINRRIMSQANVQRFTHSLSINDWTNISLCRDTQLAYTMFNDEYLSAYNTGFAEKRIKCKGTGKSRGWQWVSLHIYGIKIKCLRRH